MPPSQFQTFFDALIGDWLLTKRILPHGHFNGTARFERQLQNQLLFSEKGTLHLPQGIFENSGNQYLYQLNANTIEVYFQGFRTGLFQTLTPIDKQSLMGEHRCGDDLYTSKYEFISVESFNIKHEVKGPKKDYRIEAVFKRAT